MAELKRKTLCEHYNSEYEGDFRFDEDTVEFDFPKLANVINENAKWQLAFDKIEEFLLVNKNWYDIIETIFITSDGNRGRGPRSSKFDKKFVDSRFQYRCLGEENGPRRYIDLYESRWKGRSLLNDELNHWDHIHINYYGPILGQPVSVTPVNPNYDLDLLWFALDEQGKMTITLKEESSLPNNIKIFWRFQSLEGFNDVNADIRYGSVSKTSSTKIKESLSRPGISEGNERWIHVVFADMKSGGCIDRKVNIDLSKSLMSKWSYRDRVQLFESKL